MTRKVAMVGNHDLVIDAAIGAQIVDLIGTLPEDALVLTRGVAGLEQFVAYACMILNRRCFTYVGKGAGDNLDRDRELAADCTELWAFFAYDNLDRATGASKVVERALDAGKPVRVATVVEGSLVWGDQ